MTSPRQPETFGQYDKLNANHQRFVDEYLIDLNGVAAAVRAGYTEGMYSGVLLARDDIQKAISERRDMLAGERAAQGAQFVLGKLWDIATADTRELVELRRVPCRYCWGDNNQYQFSKVEAIRLLKAHEYGVNNLPLQALWPVGPAEQAYYEAGKAGLSFDPQGGDGYTSNREVNANCTECAGCGITLHLFHDTRTLGPAARQLYRGVKIGDKGKIEVLMANQDAARDMLARHYGVAVERKEVFVRAVDPRRLSDDELRQAINELEAITLDSKDYQQIDDSKVVAKFTQTDKDRRRANIAKVHQAQRQARVDSHRAAVRRPRS